MSPYGALCVGEITQAKAIIRLAKQILSERNSALGRRALARAIAECAQVIVDFDPALPIPPRPYGGPRQPD